MAGKDDNIPDRIMGLMLGAAVGDALGLPAEGMSAKRIARRWPAPLRHRFLLGRGMVSDDTEHLFCTAQSLIASGGEVETFRRALAGRLRWWLLALPAGVGLATARSLGKLWLGWQPEKSGVWSAGNGPAMRSAILGARFADDEATLRAFVEASTQMTHRDPKALTGALAVALAAAAVMRGAAQDATLFHTWQTLSSDDEWQRAMTLLREELARHSSVAAFSEELGGRCEVSGYIYRTVPVALYAWLRHRGNFRMALQELIACGGDTDTAASITGALAGMECGEEGMPKEWVAGIWEWPRSTRVLREGASRVADHHCRAPVRYPVAGVIPRNLFFLIVVLLHGLRRLIPG